eukprot:scaffold40854_cov34-Tisochrysis_lutea.AAC.2
MSVCGGSPPLSSKNRLAPRRSRLVFVAEARIWTAPPCRHGSRTQSPCKSATPSTGRGVESLEIRQRQCERLVENVPERRSCHAKLANKARGDVASSLACYPTRGTASEGARAFLGRAHNGSVSPWA